VSLGFVGKVYDLAASWSRPNAPSLVLSLSESLKSYVKSRVMLYAAELFWPRCGRISQGYAVSDLEPDNISTSSVIPLWCQTRPITESKGSALTST